MPLTFALARALDKQDDDGGENLRKPAALRDCETKNRTSAPELGRKKKKEKLQLPASLAIGKRGGVDWQQTRLTASHNSRSVT